jgi:hypothetical protein
MGVERCRADKNGTEEVIRTDSGQTAGGKVPGVRDAREVWAEKRMISVLPLNSTRT